VIVALVAAAIASLIKSTTGMGYPLVLIPVLALFMDITDAVVIVAPSNLYLNGLVAWNVRGYRHEARTLRPFVTAGLIGAAIGAILLPVAPDRALRWLVVGVIAFFVVNRLRGERRVLSPKLADRLAVPVGGTAGLLQGAAGLSGPIVIPWFLSLGLPRDTYIYCITTVFALTGTTQLLVFAVQGTFTLRLFTLGVALIPVALLITPLGIRLRERIPLLVFERAVVALLIASAASIVVRLL
jgi:uncharacterized membrane protein YfcA